MINDYPSHTTDAQIKRANELSDLIDAIEQSSFYPDNVAPSQLKSLWTEFNDIVYPLDDKGKEIVKKPKRDPALRSIFDSLVGADHFRFRPLVSNARHNIKVKDEVHARLIHDKLKTLVPLYEQYDVLKFQVGATKIRILDLEAEIKVLSQTDSIESQLAKVTQKS